MLKRIHSLNIMKQSLLNLDERKLLKIIKYNKKLQMEMNIELIKYTIQILREEYDLDSTGMFEYIKEIVDTRIGARSKKKYWKEVESNLGVGTRYTRCLVITIDDISYIIDVTKKDPTEILRRAYEEEMSQLKPFNIQRKWKFDPYDGR